MKAVNFLLISAIATITMSCSLFKQTTSNQASTNELIKSEIGRASDEERYLNDYNNSNSAANLNGKWFVAVIDSSIVKPNVDCSYIEFESTNIGQIKCYAYDGCNYINGEYKLIGGSKLKKASEFISTLKSCDNNDYEAKMFATVSDIAEFSIENVNGEHQLRLKDSKGVTLMILKRADGEDLSGAWQIVTLNGINIEKDLNLKLVFDMINKTIHGNIGCNIMNGTIDTKQGLPTEISFSNVITTRMSCPNMETEIELLQAIESVKKIEINDNGKFASLFNKNGESVITIKRLIIE